MANSKPGPLAIPLAAALLLWPAVWNGYPIVFADTGTYLSQAIHHYAGWDRPVFYSLFMWPLHATVSVWPVVIAQALIAATVLRLVCRILLPGCPTSLFLAAVGLLSLLTWLPWLVSELMPDLFTPLLVLLLVVLAWAPERLSRRESLLVVPLATFMVASQQSSVPLAVILPAALAALACQLNSPASGRDRLHRALLAALPSALAMLSLCGANLAAHGRFALSPYGNVFLLARVIYDGPGMAVLRRDCAAEHWRLCPFLDRMPADSDGFLWRPDSPLVLAGGPKVVFQDAGAIIAAAWLADPAGAARAMLRNTLVQLGRFDSGDGLEPWPAQVTPWIDHDFPPAEGQAYAAARQQQGRLAVPAALAATHRAGALLGLIGCAALLPWAARRRSACLGFLVAVLLVVPLTAAITGGLSAPHDRYQSRIMWLPPFVAAFTLLSLTRGGSVPRAMSIRPLPPRFVASPYPLGRSQGEPIPKADYFPDSRLTLS